MANKKKKYEPPMVKEIGGVFEQALGLTCTAGGRFNSGDCAMGSFPGGTCSRGTGDNIPFDCFAGGSDGANCQWGFGNASTCRRGLGVG